MQKEKLSMSNYIIIWFIRIRSLILLTALYDLRCSKGIILLTLNTERDTTIRSVESTWLYYLVEKYLTKSFSNGTILHVWSH